MSAVLKAENIHYAYEEGIPVLRSVNAELRGGELLGIVGPNGSGKSTLLRIMAGQLPPQEGGVLLNGTGLEKISARNRGRTVAYLPQQVQPTFHLRVREVVMLGRHPHGGLFGAGDRVKDEAVLGRCLAMTHCEALEERSFETLSGGERQRVLLASVLAQEPEVMLLDEATAALDLHHQEEIFSMLRRLSKDSGHGIAVITHDLNLAGRHCDTLLLLNDAHEVEASGNAREVLRPEILSRAYGVPIEVGVNPLTGTPLVQALVVEGSA